MAKRLLGAVTALDLRQLADTRDELVGAIWRVAGLAGLLADETRGVEVWATTEELTEELSFVGRRVRYVSQLLRWVGSAGARR
jgi:hypothetical protein